MNPTLLTPAIFAGSLGTLVLGLIIAAFGAVLNKSILNKIGYGIAGIGLIAVMATLASCIATGWKEITKHTLILLVGGISGVSLIIFVGMKLEQLFKKAKKAS